MTFSTLFKTHENADCEKLQDIIRYLFYLGYDFRPTYIIERNFPSTVKIIPTLVINNNNQYCQEYIGLNEIIKYLEITTQKLNLLNEALKFAKNNPNYRIHDISTHKIGQIPFA